MGPKMARLYTELGAANREVERIERAIGDEQRACEHSREHDNPNWCDRCGAILSADDPPVLR
jgi:hypothetical protein